MLSPESALGNVFVLISSSFSFLSDGGVGKQQGLEEVKKLGIANLAGLAVEKTAEQRAKEEKDAKTHREALINASESLEASYRVGDSHSALSFSMYVYVYVRVFLCSSLPLALGMSQIKLATALLRLGEIGESLGILSEMETMDPFAERSLQVTTVNIIKTEVDKVYQRCSPFCTEGTLLHLAFIFEKECT